jgi:hypothetical protein
VSGTYAAIALALTGFQREAFNVRNRVPGAELSGTYSVSSGRAGVSRMPLFALLALRVAARRD